MYCVVRKREMSIVDEFTQLHGSEYIYRGLSLCDKHYIEAREIGVKWDIEQVLSTMIEPLEDI